MDWENLVDTIFLWYNEFVEWYLVQPIYGQILSIIGVIALFSLAITLIYYVIKGIAYLIYYILKGIYYLLKYVGLGTFKLCEGFYKLVSGEVKAKNEIEKGNIFAENPFTRIQNSNFFCSECGKQFSEKMIKKILVNGNVFCINCGKEFSLIQVQTSVSH